MLVYLDTSIIMTASGKPDIAEAIANIQKRPDILCVFSAAHFDDLVSASSDTDRCFVQDVLAWPNKIWCVDGSELPRLELQELLAARAEERPPHVVVPLRQHLAPLPTAEQRDTMRRDRAEFKEGWARAETHGKSARASTHGKKVPGQDLLAFLSGDAIECPAACSELWSAVQSQARHLEVETGRCLEDLRTIALSNIDESLWPNPSVVTAGISSMYDMFMAARNNNPDKYVAAMLAMQSSAQGFMQQVNPMGLNLSAEKGHQFQQFVCWLPEQARRVLFADSGLLQEAFDDWIHAVSICPAGLVLREVSWQMARDTSAPAVQSDQTDRFHVALLPYVDVLFADKRIVSYVRQARGIPPDWRARCLSASDFADWVRELPDFQPLTYHEKGDGT